MLCKFTHEPGQEMFLISSKGPQRRLFVEVKDLVRDREQSRSG